MWYSTQHHYLLGSEYIDVLNSIYDSQRIHVMSLCTCFNYKHIYLVHQGITLKNDNIDCVLNMKIFSMLTCNMHSYVIAIAIAIIYIYIYIYILHIYIVNILMFV